MAVITSDTFTVGADTNLQLHAADVGGTWALEETSAGGTGLVCVAATDDVGGPGGGGSARTLYTSRPNPATVEYDLQISWKTGAPASTDDPFFLLARMLDVSNYYSAGGYQAANTADVRIFKTVAGVKTQLASGDRGNVAGDVFKFEVRDATKKLFVNGAENSVHRRQCLDRRRAGRVRSRQRMDGNDRRHQRGQSLR